jgi:hypothetical protein
MTPQEKAAKTAPFFKKVTIAVIEHLLAKIEEEPAPTDFSMSDIQDVVLKIIPSIAEEDREGFMQLAALGITMVVHKKINLDIQRLKREAS